MTRSRPLEGRDSLTRSTPRWTANEPIKIPYCMYTVFLYAILLRVRCFRVTDRLEKYGSLCCAQRTLRHLGTTDSWLAGFIYICKNICRYCSDVFYFYSVTKIYIWGENLKWRILAGKFETWNFIQSPFFTLSVKFFSLLL